MPLPATGDCMQPRAEHKAAQSCHSLSVCSGELAGPNLSSDTHECSERLGKIKSTLQKKKASAPPARKQASQRRKWGTNLSRYMKENNAESNGHGI